MQLQTSDNIFPKALQRPLRLSCRLLQVSQIFTFLQEKVSATLYIYYP